MPKVNIAKAFRFMAEYIVVPVGSGTGAGLAAFAMGVAPPFALLTGVAVGIFFAHRMVDWLQRWPRALR